MIRQGSLSDGVQRDKGFNIVCLFILFVYFMFFLSLFVLSLFFAIKYLSGSVSFPW